MPRKLLPHVCDDQFENLLSYCLAEVVRRARTAADAELVGQILGRALDLEIPPLPGVTLDFVLAGLRLAFLHDHKLAATIVEFIEVHNLPLWQDVRGFLENVVDLDV